MSQSAPHLELPPLKEGWTRWVHITSAQLATSIKQNGLHYSNHGTLSSTAVLCDEEKAVAHLQAALDPDFDPRFRLGDGAMAVIVDLPNSLARVHDLRSAYMPPGTVPPKFIRAIVYGKDMSVESVHESPATWSEKFERRPEARIGGKSSPASPRSSSLIPPPPSDDSSPDIW